MGPAVGPTGRCRGPMGGGVVGCGGESLSGTLNVPRYVKHTA